MNPRTRRLRKKRRRERRLRAWFERWRAVFAARQAALVLLVPGYARTFQVTFRLAEPV